MAVLDDTTLASNNSVNISNSTNLLTIDACTDQGDEESEMKRNHVYHPFYHPHYRFYDDSAEHTTSSVASTPQRSNQSSSSARSNLEEERNAHDHHLNEKSENHPMMISQEEGQMHHHHGPDYYSYPYSVDPRSYVPCSPMSKSSKNISAAANGNKNIPTTHPHGHNHQFPSHPSGYYKTGWYYRPQHQQPYPSEAYSRYCCPSPPPPPPYSDYYYAEGRKDVARAPSPYHYPIWYEEEGNGNRIHPYHLHANASMPAASKDCNHRANYYSWKQLHKDGENEQTRMITDNRGTPASSPPSDKKTIPKVTPLNTTGGGRKLANSVAINLPSSEAAIVPSISNDSGSSIEDNKGYAASTFTSSSPFVGLRDMDIVCGRGAPTNYHVGNELFRGLVSNYQTSYFCAKRSDKPRIAMKVLDVLQSRGARFVRRQKNGHSSTTGNVQSAAVADGSGNTLNKVKGSPPSSTPSSYWVEVPHKLAYEKVCQALRDGAPKVQRQILSSSYRSAAQDSILNTRRKSRGEDIHQQSIAQQGSNGEVESKNGSVAD